MVFFLGFFGLIGALTLFGPEPLQPNRNFGWKVRLAYAVFVAFLGFSPVFGLYVAGIFGYRPDSVIALAFAWVPIALALPLSLLTATLMGEFTRESYWEYLLSFRKSSSIGPINPSTRRGLMQMMASTSLAAFVIGMLIFANT